MIAMRFDYRDIFKAARVAFSFQRLWIQFVGFSIGYLSYVILTYASLALAGNSLPVLWSRFGLLPCITGYPMSWFGWIIYALGCLLLVVFWLLSSAAVARATYMHLKGNYFYTWKESIRFAFKKKGGSIMATPLAIALITFFIGLGGFVIGLLGRIPVVGQLGVSLFALLWFMASLFLVVVLIALGVSLFLSPAILTTTDDDAFEGVFQSFSTFFAQPWRFIFYEFLLLIVALLAFVIFSFFAKLAWGLMTTLIIWGMGDAYANLSYTASYLVQNWIYAAVAWSKMLPADLGTTLFFSREFAAIPVPLVTTISAHIFAVLLLFIGGFIVAYPLAVFNAGQCIIFLNLRMKKDDENLLERKDKEEEDEDEEAEESPSDKSVEEETDESDQ